jgi:hypothetical protein
MHTVVQNRNLLESISIKNEKLLCAKFDATFSVLDNISLLEILNIYNGV